MTTIHISLQSSLAPERVLDAAHDFSARRAEVWPAVSVPRLTVHDYGDTWADVTEGTRAGPVVNWERCRAMTGHTPGRSPRPATVIDSNVYGVPGSSWELEAEPSDSGSSVEMIWGAGVQHQPSRVAIRAPRFGSSARDCLEATRERCSTTCSDLRETPPSHATAVASRRIPSMRSRTPDSATLIRAPHTTVRESGRPVGGVIVVDVVERDLRRCGEPDLRGERADLLRGERLELLARLPHVGNPDPVFGRGDPVEQTARGAAPVGACAPSSPAPGRTDPAWRPCTQ